MVRTMFGMLIAATVLVAVAVADDAKDAAIEKDRMRIQGTWRIVSLEFNGSRVADEDAKKLIVVNGVDGTWSVQSDGKDLMKGTSTIDPTQTPKTIDFTPTEGDEKGKQFKGIYELGKDTRRLCFGPSGKPRPKEFISLTGSEHIVVTFERVEEE